MFSYVPVSPQYRERPDIFAQPEQQQTQQQPQMPNLLQGLQLYQQFAGTGTGVGGGVGGSLGGEAGSMGAGSGSGSGIAAAGPWAALAAIIAANESYQYDNNNRDRDKAKYAKDLIKGDVIEQDVDRYLGHKAGRVARDLQDAFNPLHLDDAIKKPKEWLTGLLS